MQPRCGCNSGVVFSLGPWGWCAGADGALGQRRMHNPGYIRPIFAIFRYLGPKWPIFEGPLLRGHVADVLQGWAGGHAKAHF